MEMTLGKEGDTFDVLSLFKKLFVRIENAGDSAVLFDGGVAAFGNEIADRDLRNIGMRLEKRNEENRYNKCGA